MIRAKAKEIISFWLYLDRKEAGLEDYGSAQTDQDGAERVLQFFEKTERGELTKNWQWQHTYEDYKRFECIYQQIDIEEINKN